MRGEASWRSSRRAVVVVGVGLALAAPAQALAADRYVDAGTGTDAGACTLAAPCATVGFALAAAAAGEEVAIDNGTYLEAVTVGGERSLVYEDFVPGDGSDPPLIDGGLGTAVTVQASGAGHIRDLRLHGDTSAVELNGLAVVDDNTMDDPDAAAAVGVRLAFGAAGSEVRGNAIEDPAPGPGRTRLGIFSTVTGVTLADNSITGMSVGMSFAGGSPANVVAGNLIEGTHDAGGVGTAIRVFCCAGAVGPIIRENTIRDPTDPSARGIVLQDVATLERNEITGHADGLFVSADTQGVTLEGDRIWGNNGRGIWVFDNNPVPEMSAVTATNVTVVGNGNDLYIQDSDLVLDSSVIGNAIGTVGAASCTITFSRADDAGNDPSGCDAFQTTTAPGFANAAAGDFHLMPGSALLDAGNPADPGAGAIDFEGDPRAIDAVLDCENVERRDIGADEYVPDALEIDCVPPETTIESGPQQGQVINDRTPVIGFSSDDPGATFECSVDGALFAPCSHQTQHILGPLNDGEHGFSVRSVDPAENADPTPAQVSFTVDTVAPDTTLTKKPPKRLRRTRATFRFTADESPVTFQCKLDARAYAPCASPHKVTVKPGKHKLLVRAADEAGNIEVQPARYAFKRIRRR